ncbi:hypothetical protein BDR26DRAFT_936498 [Obelidium mucronatum]|nr:hypothetical protein BDR26DRAFT_936498 [Obelidium mucronatum]
MANLPMLQTFNLAALGKTVKNTLYASTHFQVLVFHHDSVVFYQPLKDFDIWPTQTHLLVTHLQKSFFDNIHIVNGDQHGESDCAFRCLDFIRQYIALTERVMCVPYDGDLVQGKSERFLKGALKGGMGETAKHQVKDADTSSEAYSPEDDCGESLSSSLSDASDSSEEETDDNDSSSASSSDNNGSLDSDIDSEAGVGAKRLQHL